MGRHNGADLLNRGIAQAAARHDLDFVNVTKRFRNHGVNAPRPWILGALDPGRFHPNTKGYRAYTSAVAATLRSARLK